MKPNQDDRQDRQLTKSLPIITAKQNATDLQSLLDYLNNHQHELKETITNHGAIAIRGYEVKTPKQFQQVGLSIFPNLQNQYPGGAPRQKVTEYIWNASELPSYVPIPESYRIILLPIR